ncbi:hypothetical protein N7489_003289, partial [Penicillium chrysogenum]
SGNAAERVNPYRDRLGLADHTQGSGLSAEALVAQSNLSRTKRVKFQFCINLHLDCHSTRAQCATLGYAGPTSRMKYEPAPTKSAQTAQPSTEELLSVPAVTEVTTAARSQVHGNVMT